MGSPTDEPCREYPIAHTGEETQHTVTLTYSFEIMDNEVSEAAFEKVMGYNEANPQTGSVWPYNSASWHEAAAFCNALSVGYSPCYKAILSGTPCKMKDDCVATEVCINSSCVHYEEAGPYIGKITTCPGYRLPTEAEWEYAYRAGTTSPLYNGAIVAASCLSCNKPDLDAIVDKIAWYCINKPSNRAVRLDNLKQDNAWKLYNMAGNLREWCHDEFVKDLGSAAVTDPVAPPTPTTHFNIVRGGSYLTPSAQLRAAYRGWYDRKARGTDIGLRCVRSLPSSPDAGIDSGPADAASADAVDAGGPGG